MEKRLVASPSILALIFLGHRRRIRVLHLKPGRSSPVASYRRNAAIPSGAWHQGTMRTGRGFSRHGSNPV
jgi:hypothetical protein